MDKNKMCTDDLSQFIDCSNDKTRINYLYTAFRTQEQNPLDYGDKMKFWTSVLEKWCAHHKRPVFTLSDLNRSFLRNGISPQCFPVMVEDMYKSGELVPEAEFIRNPPQQTWTAWTVDWIVKKPTVWAFTKVKDSIIKSAAIDENTRLVYVSACKALGNEFMAKQNKECLLELAELATLWGQPDLQQTLVLAHGLRREGQAAVQDGNPTLIKLGSSKITEIDVGLHTLRKNEQTLTRHVEELEAEKQAAVEEAKKYVSKNMRQAARSCLRKKHVLDKCIEKRASALDNLHVLMNRIREAETDAKVFDAYKLGATALKNTLKTSGLTEDTATNALLEVQEVLDVHDEIEAALSQPVQPDDDLEEELAELLKEESEPPGPSEPPDGLEKTLASLSVLPEPPKSPDFPKVPAAYPSL